MDQDVTQGYESPQVTVLGTLPELTEGTAGLGGGEPLAGSSPN